MKAVLPTHRVNKTRTPIPTMSVSPCPPPLQCRGLPCYLVFLDRSRVFCYKEQAHGRDKSFRTGSSSALTYGLPQPADAVRSLTPYFLITHF